MNTDLTESTNITYRTLRMLQEHDWWDGYTTDEGLAQAKECIIKLFPREEMKEAYQIVKDFLVKGECPPKGLFEQ